VSARVVAENKIKPLFVETIPVQVLPSGQQKWSLDNYSFNNDESEFLSRLLLQDAANTKESFIL